MKRNLMSEEDLKKIAIAMLIPQEWRAKQIEDLKAKGDSEEETLNRLKVLNNKTNEECIGK